MGGLRILAVLCGLATGALGLAGCGLIGDFDPKPDLGQPAPDAGLVDAGRRPDAGQDAGVDAGAPLRCPFAPGDRNAIRFLRGGDGTGRNPDMDLGSFALSLVGLVRALTEDGHVLEDTVEPVEMEDLLGPGVGTVVFGSNNEPYDADDVRCFAQWVLDGGSALFFHDSEFAPEFGAAAQRSDQDLLNPFDLVMNPDSLQNSRLVVDATGIDHPVLDGVDEFTGNGISPCTALDLEERADVELLVGFDGLMRRAVDGELEPAAEADAALILLNADDGRLACLFDKETLFEGGGVNVFDLDNLQLARNLFAWLGGRSP